MTSANATLLSDIRMSQLLSAVLEWICSVQETDLKIYEKYRPVDTDGNMMH